ncbi:MAG: regulatory protein RecX [Gammaproteobacteria bacterium]|nr:regulatory protein RecX [Gammaproteobacteria bacterium]
MNCIAKLKRRFPDCPDWIDEAVDQLAAENLQSDRRFTESFVRSRVQRGQGPLKITAELRGKGIGDDMIAHAFDECEVDWFSLAAAVYSKRFGQESPGDAKERAKRSRFMQSRGFSFDHISNIL